MLHILQTALELGFLYALVPMALFLSFRILDIADMTTDGCFVLGTAVSVTMAAAGHPFLAVPAAMLAGICAGFVTAFQQTRLGVPSILAGIIIGMITSRDLGTGWGIVCMVGTFLIVQFLIGLVIRRKVNAIQQSLQTIT